MAFVGMIFTSIEASSLDDRIRAMQYDYLSQPWLMFGTSLAKISVCFYLLRTIGRRRPWNILLGMLIVLSAIVNLAFAMTSNLQCRPLAKLWNPTLEGQCIDAVISLNLRYLQEGQFPTPVQKRKGGGRRGGRRKDGDEKKTPKTNTRGNPWLTEPCSSTGFEVFNFLFLATFPILLIRDMELLKSIRWPFYTLSFAMLLSAIFSIVRTSAAAAIGPAPVFSSSVLLNTIFAVLIQNFALIAANILPLGPLFSPKAMDLSRLAEEDSSENELEEQRGTSTGEGGARGHAKQASSSRSSLISLKRSTHLIIQGPRKMDDDDNDDDNNDDKNNTTAPVPDRAESAMSMHNTTRPGTSATMRSVRSQTGAAVTAGGSEERNIIVASQIASDSIDADALHRGILRTISVHVVEEEVVAGDAEVAGDGGCENEWKMMMEGPRR